MLTHSLRQSVVLVLLVTQLFGCHHWVPSSITPEAEDSVELRAATLAEYDRSTLRLMLRDGSHVELFNPITIVGDSIRDAAWGTYHASGGEAASATAIADIEGVQALEPDRAGTAAVGGFVIGGLLVGLRVLAATARCPPLDVYGTHCRER